MSNQQRIKYICKIDPNDPSKISSVQIEQNGNIINNFIDEFSQNDIPSAISEGWQKSFEKITDGNKIAKISNTKFVILDTTLEYRENLKQAQEKYGSEGLKDNFIAGFQTAGDFIAAESSALIGAKTGSAIGTFVAGPVGTAIGGVLGFVGGGIVGSNLFDSSGISDWIGEKTAKLYDISSNWIAENFTTQDNVKDIANLVEFLCSDKASYITGQSIYLDGGLSLIGQETVARKLI